MLDDAQILTIEKRLLERGYGKEPDALKRPRGFLSGFTAGLCISGIAH